MLSDLLLYVTLSTIRCEWLSATKLPFSSGPACALSLPEYIISDTASITLLHFIVDIIITCARIHS
jgi:hypothetical protein